MSNEKQEIKDIIIELWEDEISYRDIAQYLNDKLQISYWDSERVRDIVRKHRKQEIEKKVDKITQHKTYNPIKLKPKGILDLADLHIPFQIDNILDIVEKHKDEISAIVLSGDILDMFSISRFTTLHEMPVENELIIALDLIGKIKSIINKEVKIILIYGNHEKRWATYIARMQEKKLYKFLNPKVLEMLKIGFTIYEDGYETKYEGIEDLIIIDSWYVNIENELIICHPNNYSKADVKNAKMAIEYFITNGEEFNAVAVSHTHHQNITHDYLGKYGVEVGCLCKPFDYTDGYTSCRRNINGYALFKFDSNGKLDKNETKLYELEMNFEKKNTSVKVF